MRPQVLALGLLSFLPFSRAEAEPGRARARHQREWDAKAKKMDERLLRMRKHRVDMWILMSRENNPDPILDLFGAYGVSGWYGHRDAYIFYDAGKDGLETTVIGTHLNDHLKRFYANIISYAEERGIGEGIINSVYSHSQGNWVHDAGAWTSFDWPERYGQHPREPIRAREIWSIEYSTSLDLPEWDGQRMSMQREEDAWVDERGVVRYFAGPQQELWLIASAR